MKHGVWAMNYPVVRTMSEVVEFAVVAEQAGWDGVFVSDSITDGATDPWVTQPLEQTLATLRLSLLHL